MIIPDEQVSAIVFPGRAFEYAQAHYQQFPRISFEDDLLDYLKHGFVVSRPNLFAMAKVILHPLNMLRPAWFIRYACGEIEQLVYVLPFPLDTLVFCRNDDGKLRIYSWENLKRKAFALTARRRRTESLRGTSHLDLAGSTPVAAKKVEVG